MYTELTNITIFASLNTSSYVQDVDHQLVYNIHYTLYTVQCILYHQRPGFIQARVTGHNLDANPPGSDERTR